MFSKTRYYYYTHDFRLSARDGGGGVESRTETEYFIIRATSVYYTRGRHPIPTFNRPESPRADVYDHNMCLRAGTDINGY